MVVFDVDFVYQIIGIVVFKVWIQECVDEVIFFLDGIYFEVFEQVRYIEGMIVFIYDGGVYYIFLFDDFFCFGCMWWLVFDGVNIFIMW